MLSIDPSSPFTQGALLGDRIRLSDHFLDPGVFIRSMASRGSLGGLSEATLQAALLMDASGQGRRVPRDRGRRPGRGRHHRPRRHRRAGADARLGRLGPGAQGRRDGDPRRDRRQQVRPPAHRHDGPRDPRHALARRPRRAGACRSCKTEASRAEGIEELAEKIREHRAFIEDAGHARGAPPAQPHERGAGAGGSAAAAPARGRRCARTSRCRSCSTRWWHAGSIRPARRRSCWNASLIAPHRGSARSMSSRLLSASTRRSPCPTRCGASRAGGSTTRSTSCAAAPTARRARGGPRGAQGHEEAARAAAAGARRAGRRASTPPRTPASATPPPSSPGCATRTSCSRRSAT